MNNSIVEKKLASICSQVTDGTHDSPKLQESGVPFIKGKHISSGQINFDNCDFITYEDHLKVIARSKPEKGDTLFSNIGSVGDTAFVKTNIEFSIKNVALLKPDKDKVLPRYLNYLIRSPVFKQSLLAKKSGSAQPFIGLSTLRNHIVNYHKDVRTQYRIASILSAYDDLIENNTRRIKILEEMAQRIYNEWFVYFRFPGHEKVKMVDSELGRIPSGWEIGAIKNICRVIPGFAFKSKDWSDKGIPVVKIKNIRPGNFVDTDQIDHVPKEIIEPKHLKYKLNNGDYLVAMTGATAGKVGKLRTNTSMLLNQRVAKLEPFDAYEQYLWCRISNNGAEKEFYRLADGAAQPNMSGSQIESVSLLIPPEGMLKNFSNIVSPLIDQVDVLFFKNTNLRKTRDILLPKLISGEIDVSEMPDPEEAAAA